MEMRCNRLGKAFCSSWRRFALSTLRALAKTTVFGVDKTWTGDQGDLSDPLVTGHRTSELGNSPCFTCLASSAPMPREAPVINQTAEGAIEEGIYGGVCHRHKRTKPRPLIGIGLGRTFFQDLLPRSLESNDFVRVPSASDTDDYCKELSIWLSIPDPTLTASSLRQLHSHSSALARTTKTQTPE